jgi:hypothetical protein
MKELNDVNGYHITIIDLKESLLPPRKEKEFE